MPTKKQTIGKKIALARKNAGLTQASLAEMIGISEKYLSRIECSKQSPNIMVVVKICESLYMSADELLLTRTIDSNDMLEAKIKLEIEQFSQDDKALIFSILQAIKSIKNNY